MTIGLIRRAWHWSDQAQLSFWDSLILAAGRTHGVRVASQRRFSNRPPVRAVTVINPFLHTPAEFGLTPPEHKKSRYLIHLSRRIFQPPWR